MFFYIIKIPSNTTLFPKNSKIGRKDTTFFRNNQIFSVLFYKKKNVLTYADSNNKNTRTHAKPTQGG